MKNFKRLVAGTIAATMALALSVSAFAEVEVTSDDNVTYASAAATYGNTITAKDGTQMTVVIFDATKELANLTGEDLLYINQDEEGVLSLTSMGTKIDLLEANEDGSAKYAGEYVIRVGYYNAENVWTVAEGTFTVATKAVVPPTPTYILGDANMDKEIKIADATVIVDYILGFLTDPSTQIDLEAANCDGKEDVKIGDATAIVDYILGFNTLPPRE